MKVRCATRRTDGYKLDPQVSSSRMCHVDLFNLLRCVGVIWFQFSCSPIFINLDLHDGNFNHFIKSTTKESINEKLD
jgi:hypothetical protein